jgi:hypothetical protein
MVEVIDTFDKFRKDSSLMFSYHRINKPLSLRRTLASTASALHCIRELCNQQVPHDMATISIFCQTLNSEAASPFKTGPHPKASIPCHSLQLLPPHEMRAW